MSTTRQVKSLPELLREQGLISPQQLQAAQSQAARSGLSLRQTVVQQGLIGESELTNLLAEQFGMTTVDLSNYMIKPEAIQAVPESLARKHAIIPLFRIGPTLTVAVADPLNFFALDEVRLKARCDVKAVLACDSAIRKAIDQYYGSAGTVEKVAKVLEAARTPTLEADSAQDGPVIKLVDLLVTQAMKEAASDIHLEPGDGALRTRLRVDGLLHEVAGPPTQLHAAVVTRIKVLANLDVAEKRKPQDGRFRLRLEGKDIDLRVSTVPTQFGEKVVMRLLDRSAAVVSLDQLGCPPQTLERLSALIRRPHGILLVTGPTGSGKTTTLYAILSVLNSIEKNILTVEDPIEYQLAGINQVQVNPKADITFASALRAFLRQDPDIIMVGEIRDRETADVSIQAALTGHLVLATLHTNDAPGALARLMDMGIEPFLIGSSVVGILAQRLVRVVCPRCKRPDPTAGAALGIDGKRCVRGAGCEACKQRGYRGRLGLFELLTVTDEVRGHIAERAASHVIRETGRAAGMTTLREDGVAKVLAGVTTAEEVLRVTQLEE